MIASDLARFYSCVNNLSAMQGLPLLCNCTGKMNWPHQGVYFFTEPGEMRQSGDPRIVRVGTHAVSLGSRTSLWNRLSQHRGTSKGGGNHRGSIFRLMVGQALLTRMSDEAKQSASQWGIGSNATADVRVSEDWLEKLVSNYIGSMGILWLTVEDPAGPTSMRSWIERNSIALLSEANRQGLERHSTNWLGLRTCRSSVLESGLWNSRHVNEQYDGSFLNDLENLVTQMGARL